MPNENLSRAKEAKKDEFYTQFRDIELEIGGYMDKDPDVFKGKTVLLPCDDPEWSQFTEYFLVNFETFGLKKLISTCYNENGKGRVFIHEGFPVPLFGEHHWSELEGNGDFASEEVTKYRDEADIIVTNPPFSLFRSFLNWIIEGNKLFCIIGNMNAISYKDVFPLMMDNQMWLGYSIHSGDREFQVPDDYPLEAAGWRVDENGKKFIRVKGVRWFTNIDHGRRHEIIPLMTMARNLKYTTHKDVREQGQYFHYDNFDGIDVPYSDIIPSDYDGVMGVPISFMDKYCPEQFKIVGNEYILNIPKGRGYVNGKRLYSRIFIKRI